MPTQKVFKQRVRARMAKTGEAYTAARHQLLQKGSEPEAPPDADEPEAGPPDTATAATVSSESLRADAFIVAEEAMVRGTGKGHADWFAILDDWGATSHRHTEIATWLREAQGTPSWWTQTITTSYERARGMRARHQMADGFEVSVTRTVNAERDRALEAFTIDALRARWLPDAPIVPRPSRSKLTARFDWTDPASRLMVTIVPKDAGRCLVAVAHGRLPDAETAERLKVAWRGWLTNLKTTLEQS